MHCNDGGLEQFSPVSQQRYSQPEDEAAEALDIAAARPVEMLD